MPDDVRRWLEGLSLEPPGDRRDGVGMYLNILVEERCRVR